MTILLITDDPDLERCSEAFCPCGAPLDPEGYCVTADAVDAAYWYTNGRAKLPAYCTVGCASDGPMT